MRYRLFDLVCPVRDCAQPLEIAATRAVCSRSHAFDRARSGYWNLLQPQDRRSTNPGDSKAAAQARRRLADAGFDTPLHDALLEIVSDLDLPWAESKPLVALDLGCGEGGWLRRLCPLETAGATAACGVDLSQAAIELAARRAAADGLLDITWVVANADRTLPLSSRSFHLATSLTARINTAEFMRVLHPEGRLVVAVAGADDLAELRVEVLGDAIEKDRLARVDHELGARFERIGRESVRWTITPDAEQAGDLLAITYRGGRSGRDEKAAALAGREITMSREVAWYQPRRSR